MKNPLDKSSGSISVEKEAENIKINYASALSSMSSNQLDIKYRPNRESKEKTISEQEVSQYVEARMQEILQMIIREISRADIKDPLTYGIVMTGGGAELRNISSLIEKFSPSHCAIEEVFFSKNVKTAISVSHARGVILLALEQYKIKTSHYTPTAIKLAVTGYGNSEKSQMQFMVKELLGLDNVPKPDDAADALAIAICHHHSYSLQFKV